MTIEADSQPMVEVVCVDKLLNVNERILVPSGTLLLEALKEVGLHFMLLEKACWSNYCSLDI